MPALNPQALSGYLIGETAKQSGVSAANIRFYEKEKLIPARGTSGNSYRVYSNEDVHRLRFIAQLRSLGMSLAEVRELLDLDWKNKKDCQQARATLDAHIMHVKERLKELKVLEKKLLELRGKCDGSAAHCHIIEALHSQAKQAPTVQRNRQKHHVI